MTSEETAGAELIVHLTCTPSEEMFIAGTDTKQLYTGALTTADIQRTGEQVTQCEYLTGGFHSGAITGLSCAVRKPLVATSSNDRTVRIWNYVTNTIEFWKDFSEEVYTISIHPAGHQILAGFSDKLRLLNILIDDFRVVREFPIRGNNLYFLMILSITFRMPRSCLFKWGSLVRRRSWQHYSNIFYHHF